jgi:gas vesicle protein
MSDNNGGGSGVLWFLAGLGVGALVGVLYAPKSGDEMRDIIRNKAQEGSDRARHHARRAREQANEWVDRGNDVLSEQKQRLRNAYEAGRQAYKEETATASEAPNS